jgi:hypothetical protein
MTTLPQPPETSARPRTSSLATASVICGFAGLCTVGASSLVGLILGIVATRRIRKSEGRLVGRSWAIGGIVLSAFMVLFMPLVVLPAVLSALDAVDLEQGCRNARTVAMEMDYEFIKGHNGDLPPADKWETLLSQSTYYPGMLRIPGDSGRSFAMNAKLSGINVNAVKDPKTTVLFFECAPDAPPSGGPELLPPQPRHAGKYIVAFVDCSVRPVAPADVGQLQWAP